MTIYFNNDMTECDKEDSGIETLVYLTNEKNEAQRLDDCVFGYPDSTFAESDVAKRWKKLPQTCDADLSGVNENCNKRKMCGETYAKINW